MRSERFNFPNAKGEQLAATLDLPLGKPTAYALFAHCFTCGKDNLAAKRIAERLAANGIAVLRFDFTGLGGSEGEFANTHFSSNVDDLVAAADHLRKTLGAPAILIGHSLGGCAVLAASHRIAEARAVVTIAAPYDPSHVVGLFKDQVDKIKEQGEVEVQLAGRPFRIKREFLDDVAEKKLDECLATLRKALLVFHSPTDDTGRHRQRLAHFRRRQASQKLRLARRRRPSAEQEERRRLCGQRHRGLGRALSRPAGDHDRRTRSRKAWSWCARRMAENSSRRS